MTSVVQDMTKGGIYMMAYERIRLYEADPWVQKLYMRAFPENERRDLAFLLRRNQEIGQVVLILKDGQKVGFYSILRCLGICHVIYFAVEDQLRGQGIGSDILAQICSTFPGERVIVDIERPDDAEKNNPQRIARKNFYIRNGFEETEIRYRWEGENYEILSCGGNVTDQEWHAFWHYIDTHDRKLLI